VSIAEDSNEFRRMVSLRASVLTASELAARVGIPDDEEFRTSITHHTQGTRALSDSREKFMRPEDPLVRYERVAHRENALADLAPGLQRRVREANRALYGDPPS
jgi:hypothetical protein